MHKQLDSLLQKEMTRKEFLAALGFGVASILGFGSIIRTLTAKPGQSGHHTSYGYGASSYGGRKV